MDKVLYKRLSYDIVGCFYDVYNELGPAHKEQVYNKSLRVCFNSKNIQYKTEPRLKIIFKGNEVGVLVPDFVVEDKVLIELKSVPMMQAVFEKQLYYYLRGTKYKLGYLVNFGSAKLDIRRKIYEYARNDSRHPIFA